MLPSAVVSTVFPALRTMNNSPRPRPNRSSGGTRESEQETRTANGVCPSAISSRRSWPSLGSLLWVVAAWSGVSATNLRLPSLRIWSAWSAVRSVFLPAACAGVRAPVPRVRLAAIGAQQAQPRKLRRDSVETIDFPPCSEAGQPPIGSRLSEGKSNEPAAWLIEVAFCVRAFDIKQVPSRPGNELRTRSLTPLLCALEQGRTPAS